MPKHTINPVEQSAKKILRDLQDEILKKARAKEYKENIESIKFFMRDKTVEWINVSADVKKILDIIEKAYEGRKSYLEALMEIKSIPLEYSIRLNEQIPKDKEILPQTLHLYLENDLIKCKAIQGKEIEIVNLSEELQESDKKSIKEVLEKQNLKYRHFKFDQQRYLTFEQKNAIHSIVSAKGYKLSLCSFLKEFFDQKKHVTFIGDSTIDNKIWVYPGAKVNGLRERLGLKRTDLPAKIKKIKNGLKAELSVIEHITTMIPNYTVHDYTNDGFTTEDCLNGNARCKVFYPDFMLTFPNELFKPLDEGKEDIKKSAYIVLSVGGNNVREFLQESEGLTEDDTKKKFIELLNKLKEQYANIFSKLRQLNPNAKIILMTQYYPSASQNHYKIYPFMTKIGRILGIGKNPNNPMDVIHALIQATYSDILNEIKDDNVVVADITSSLNPFDSHNHARQIEPSGVGGRKIAQMLKYIIEDKGSGFVYRFLPSFFKTSSSEADVIKTSFHNWTPKHPHEFTGKACYDYKLAARLIKEDEEKQAGIIIGWDDRTKRKLAQNPKLQQALIVLLQTSKDLVTCENFQKIKNNPDLQNILAAAHAYLNSGRFGFFRKHGNHGRAETKKLVLAVMQNSDKAFLTTSMRNWLATSRVHHSSRAYYAANSGFFSDVSKDAYVKANAKERQNILNMMRGKM